MSNEIDKNIVDYFQMMEASIAKMPVEQREEVYRSCGENCAKTYVIEQQRKIFEACHGDLDLMYSTSSSEYFFGRVIESGHIYEMGYPRCLCYMYPAGMLKDPVHCECSRQSILYVLHELMPDKKIKVETVGTVLTGANECTFRITIE